ncbi:MAG: glycosyltransferase family 2 protein [Thermomicrobiales bacterium]
MSDSITPSGAAAWQNEWRSAADNLRSRTNRPAGVTTVVIITRDRCESLRRTLQALAMAAGVHEIIVVDNASTGCSVAAVCEEFPCVRYLSLGVNLGAAARNIGVAHATTEFVAFSDDDSWWEPEAIPRALTCFRDFPGLGLVSGAVLVGTESRLDHVSCLQARSPLPRTASLPGPAILGFLACAAIVRTIAYREVGGYSGFLDVGGEEQLLALDMRSAGWDLCYRSDVTVRHFPASRSSAYVSRRLVMETRNRLLITWLRRPWRTAARMTMAEVRQCLQSREKAVGMMEALIRFPRLWKHRRVVRPELESDIQLLERQQQTLNDECGSASTPLRPGKGSDRLREGG